jgi:hypothetical protein
MCLGAPSGVKTISNEAGAAYGSAINQATTEFGETNTEFNDLTKALNPIVAAGPGQTGWTAQEASAINANTVDTTAAAYKNAGAAVQNGIAAEGGGNIALPSGANLGTEESLAEAGAQQEASGLRSNLIQNYDQGNQNWQFATNGIESAPTMFQSANNATNAATYSGEQAMKDEQAVASYPTWQSVAMGALGAGLDAASAFIPGAGPVAGALANVAGNAVSGAVASTGSGGK